MGVFAGCFGSIEDPRADNARHDLVEVMFISVAALGAFGSAVTAISARRRRGHREKSVEDLQRLLELSNSIAREDDPAKSRQLLDDVDAIFQRNMIACAHGDVSSGALVAIQAAVNRCHRAADVNVAFGGASVAVGNAS